MSRSTTVTIQCNLCAITSDSVGDASFTAVGQYDFCRWCMSCGPANTSCGEHTVSADGVGWACDCGVTMAMMKMTLWRYGVDHGVMAAVPNLASATAAIHVQTPNWPAPY